MQLRNLGKAQSSVNFVRLISSALFFPPRHNLLMLCCKRQQIPTFCRHIPFCETKIRSIKLVCSLNQLSWWQWQQQQHALCIWREKSSLLLWGGCWWWQFFVRIYFLRLQLVVFYWWARISSRSFLYGQPAATSLARPFISARWWTSNCSRDAER